MPRCQRTFRLLQSGIIDAASGIARWQCTHCPDNESYETVSAPDLLQYAALAQSTCFTDFGRPADAHLPTILFWGVSPECVFEPRQRQYNLYLQQNSDPYQARLQIGHEMFHRVCSQGKIFHWTHEMLACLFSVRLLRQSGADDYAAQTEREYLAQSKDCSFQQMVTADLSRPPYPIGLYGRAFQTGMEWQEKFGWAALCCLPLISGPYRPPDVARWIAGREKTCSHDLLEHNALFLNQS